MDDITVLEAFDCTIAIATPLATMVIHQKVFHGHSRVAIYPNPSGEKKTEMDFKFLTYR